MQLKHIYYNAALSVTAIFIYTYLYLHATVLCGRFQIINSFLVYH